MHNSSFALSAPPRMHAAMLLRTFLPVGTLRITISPCTHAHPQPGTVRWYAHWTDCLGGGSQVLAGGILIHCSMHKTATRRASGSQVWSYAKHSIGTGGENRTLDMSLEGSYVTTTPLPHAFLTTFPEACPPQWGCKINEPTLSICSAKLTLPTCGTYKC